MANLHLVTGYAGYEHIKATDQAAFNAALIGTGQFVLEKGGIFKAQVHTNNLVRVLDGELMMQGRFIRLDPDTYVDLEIENGEQGKLRNDIIVARYTKDIGTGVEECNLVVIKGESVASNPADPAHEEGDITNGVGTVHDYPLWRLPIDGINVGEPVALYGLPFKDSMHTLHSIREDMNQQMAEQEAQYEAAFEEQNESFQKAIDAFGGYTKEETLTNETKASFGLDDGAVPDDVLNVLSGATLVKSVPKFTKHTIANPTYGKSVGSTVSLNVNGVATDFLIVHRGKPSALYDDSCNGCWLVAKNIYTVDKWTSGSYGNSYADSTIHNYLNGTFLGLLDADAKWMVKQVKIPYAKGSAATTAQTGANGLSTKVFLLGSNEVGCSSSVYSTLVDDGSKLDYFGTGGGAEPTRVANYGSSAYPWATRTAYKSNTNQVFLVGASGDVYSARVDTSTGIRPALILPLEKDVVYYADDKGNRYSEQEYKTVITNSFGEIVSDAVRVDYGKYIGTGTNGQSNPNVMNFGFNPHAIIIRRNSSGAANGENGEALIMIAGMSQCYSGNSNYPINITWDGNSVTWWANNNATLQYNASGGGYYYIAIG